MGVTGLWQVLSEVGQLKDLSQGGETLAVDLSAWIYQASSASFHKKSSSSYFVTRTIFYRTLDLLKCGMKLIFVLDGTAPELKRNTLQKRCGSPDKSHSGLAQSIDRQSFKQQAKEVVMLLKSLGVPVVEGPGEAEKMCAHLNSSKIVDAVITDDGDALLYGAKKIYRNCDFNKKTATSVSLDDVESKLHLTPRDLITFALLSGCDYSLGGVKGVGPDQIKEMFEEIEHHGSHTDVLDRICGWAEDTHLQHLEKVKVKLEGVKRSAHCSQCQHTGSQPSHRSRGCGVCEREKGCETDSPQLCDCPWHRLKHQLEPYKREMGVRDKALQDSHFTQRSREIKEEFTNTEKEEAKITSESLAFKNPNLRDIVSLVSRTLKLDKPEIVSKLVPLFVDMQLKKEFTWTGLCPLSIEKSCRRSYVDCYQTTWAKMEEDVWTTGQTYTVDVEQELFNERHATIVSEFEENSAKKSKSSTPRSQRTIQEMFSSPEIRRRSNRATAECAITPKKGDNSNLVKNPGWKKKLNFDATSVIEIDGRSSGSDHEHSQDKEADDNSTTPFTRTSSVTLIEDLCSGDHGKSTSEDHGESTSEDHGESTSEDHGKSTSEDHGESTSEDHSKSTSEDQGTSSSQSEMIKSSIEIDVQSYNSEDLFGSDEDSTEASAVNACTRDEDSDWEIIEKDGLECGSSKTNGTTFERANADVFKNELKTVTNEVDRIKCVPQRNASKDKTTKFDEIKTSVAKCVSFDSKSDGVNISPYRNGACKNNFSKADVQDCASDNSIESSADGSGNWSRSQLHSLGLGEPESDSSSEVHPVELVDSEDSSSRLNATSSKDLHTSGGSSESGSGIGTHSELPSFAEGVPEPGSPGEVCPVDLADSSSSSSEVIMISTGGSRRHRRSSSSSDVIIIDSKNVEKTVEKVPCKRKVVETPHKASKKCKKTTKGKQKSLKDFFSNKK